MDEVKGKYQQQLEELGKLTGGLAHEIKNPLSTIKVNLKLVEEDLEDAGGSGTEDVRSEAGRHVARALRKVTVIGKEMERLEHILDGFLRYVGRCELHLVRADINEIVSDVIDFYTPQAYRYRITLHRGLHQEALICKIDADMLKQVLLNLFINAQQAMTDGGDMMIRTYREEHEVIIQVSDTGCGIAADKLGHIFEAYYSLRQQGTGLGLPTARRIVEAHNGTISVSSEPGKGTCFTVRLPMASE